MSVIAKDGYFPLFSTKRKNNIPIYSLITMSVSAFLLILIGDLKTLIDI